jgi:hypothetical protein
LFPFRLFTVSPLPPFLLRSSPSCPFVHLRGSILLGGEICPSPRDSPCPPCPPWFMSFFAIFVPRVCDSLR